MAELGPGVSVCVVGGGSREKGKKELLAAGAVRVCLGGRSPTLGEAAWLDERRPGPGSWGPSSRKHGRRSCRKVTSPPWSPAAVGLLVSPSPLCHAAVPYERLWAMGEPERPRGAGAGTLSITGLRHLSLDTQKASG